MPWEKSFDEDEILDRAMELFWQRGYKGVSMGDLVAELGVSRSSLYATYGQKQDLFLGALTQYDRVHRAEWLAALGDRFAPIESIRQAFVEVADASRAERPFGCLLVNTTLDVPNEEADIAALVQDAFDATECFFRDQLELGQRDGKLEPEADTAALAAALMALFLGMRVLARAQRPAQAIDPILRQVDTMLAAG